MKIGKEQAFANKHRAKQKAIRRYVKNRELIYPGILAAAFLFGALGGTIAESIDPRFALIGAFAGMWLGLFFAKFLVIGTG
jgi:hypothetical protein